MTAVKMSDFYQGFIQEFERQGAGIEETHAYVLACKLEPTDDLPEFKRKALWGTYGKYGEHELQWVRLIDCSSDHLRAILSGKQTYSKVKQALMVAIIGPYMSRIIESILEDRK